MQGFAFACGVRCQPVDAHSWSVIMVSCSKLSFPTEHAARAALRAVAHRRKPRRRTRQEVAVHPCLACGAWHLTSNVKALDWGKRHGRDWGPLPG